MGAAFLQGHPSTPSVPCMQKELSRREEKEAREEVGTVLTCKLSRRKKLSGVPGMIALEAGELSGVNCWACNDQGPSLKPKIGELVTVGSSLDQLIAQLTLRQSFSD